MVDINFPRYNTIAFTAETLDELRSYSVLNIVDGMLAFVAGHDDPADSNGGIFTWDGDATGDDDDDVLIAPTDVLTGRWRRILGGIGVGSGGSSSNDFVTVEQFGAIGQSTAILDETVPSAPVVIGSPTDNRAAIQAAIAYANANNIHRVLFGSRYYALRRVPYTTGNIFVANQSPWALMSSTKSVILESTNREGTKLVRLRVNGAAMAENEYELVGGGAFKNRGDGFFMEGLGGYGDVHDPSLQSLTLRDIVIDGGLRKSMTLGFEVFDKGILFQGDSNSGHFTAEGRSGVIGFGGEVVYGGGTFGAEMAKRYWTIGPDCIFGESGGSCLNPNGQTLKVERCLCYNAYIGMEGWTGELGGYLKAVFKDCTQSTLQGGVVNQDGARGGYYVLTEATDGVLPVGFLDIVCVRSPFTLGGALTGKVTAIDCSVSMSDNAAFQDGSHELNLDIVSYVHAQSLTTAVLLLGGASGSMGHDRTHIRVSCLRSKEAVLGGFSHGSAVGYYGSFGLNVSVDLSAIKNVNPVTVLAGVFDNEPLWVGVRYPGYGQTLYDAEANNNATISLIGKGPFVAFSCSGAASGVKKVNLPATGVIGGYELTLINLTANNVAGGIPVEIGNLRQQTRCILPALAATMKVRFDGTSWDVSEPPPPSYGNALLTDAATVTPDLRAGRDFEWTIAGNRTLANPTNAQPGDSGTIRIKQDATGSRIIGYGANWRFAAGAASTLSTAANAIDIISYVVGNDGTIPAVLTKGF